MYGDELEHSGDFLDEIAQWVNQLDNHVASVPIIKEPVRRKLRRSMSARSTREGFPIDLRTPPPSARTPQLACRTPSIISPVLPLLDGSPLGAPYELGVPVEFGAATPHWAWQGLRSGSASPRSHILPPASSSRPGTPMVSGPAPISHLARNMSAGQMYTVNSGCPRTTTVAAVATVAQATAVSQASYAPEIRIQAMPVTPSVPTYTCVNRTPLHDVRCAPAASVPQPIHVAHGGGTPLRTRTPLAVRLAR
jgi:hypothetical protein